MVAILCPFHDTSFKWRKQRLRNSISNSKQLRTWSSDARIPAFCFVLLLFLFVLLYKSTDNRGFLPGQGAKAPLSESSFTFLGASSPYSMSLCAYPLTFVKCAKCAYPLKFAKFIGLNQVLRDMCFMNGYYWGQR